MTREQKIRKARALRSRGWTNRQIALAVEANESTVRNWYLGNDCEKCGTPTDGSRAKRSRLCSTCQAQINSGRNENLVTLWEDGVPAWQIAETLGMTEAAVIRWVDAERRLKGRSLSRRQLDHTTADERYALIGRRVKEGRSNREIGEEVGTSTASAAEMIRRARSLGYDIPYRDELVPA